MAVQLSAAARNAKLDAIESYAGTSVALEIRVGTQPTNCATAPGGGDTVLVTINLPSDWMAAASGGTKAKSGTWQDTSADASGTAGYFRLYNSQATKDETTCFMQGDVGQGSGTLSLDNVVLVAGQQVTINSFTWTEANA